MKIYAIYEITPAPFGDDHRRVQSFDCMEDAQKVLNVLESVNMDFHLYKIVTWKEK